MRRLVCLGACGVTLAVALAASLGFGADPEIAWREKMRVVVTTNGMATASDTNATTTATAHTPAYAGQFLFGGAGEGTNGVWVAKGVTTNDWVRIAP